MGDTLEDYVSIIELLNIAGEIEGRKKLQKIVYILKNLGANFVEDFYFHYFGPYSDTLTVELEELKSMNIIEEEKEENGSYPKYKYRLKPNDNYTYENHGNLEKYRALIEKLNNQKARFLELVATIMYFKQEGYSRDKIISKVKIVKSDKNYTNEEIESAFEFLRDIQ
ncbi:MAG: hypothetical protein QME46_10715 [Thermoanaerobacteraceae bacterium]|nr:hypothetical protein [Thermoanaerobacteraceae bacterium]